MRSPVRNSPEKGSDRPRGVSPPRGRRDRLHEDLRQQQHPSSRGDRAGHHDLVTRRDHAARIRCVVVESRRVPCHASVRYFQDQIDPERAVHHQGPTGPASDDPLSNVQRWSGGTGTTQVRSGKVLDLDMWPDAFWREYFDTKRVSDNPRETP